MQALVINEPGETSFIDIELPKIKADELMLNVTHVGLCGSDLNTFRGLNPLAKMPCIPGHEISGLISKVGCDVPAHFKTGASAIVVPYIECGECSACKRNRPNACRNNKTLGVQQGGGMQHHLAINHERVILNDTLSGLHQALVEPLAVGFHAIERAQVNEGETVVVIGGGVIGVGAILGALERKAKVIVIEVSENKRDKLLSFGVEKVLNPLDIDVIAEVQQLTNGEGSDVTIEAVGLPKTFTQAIDLTCYGGKVVYLGYAKDSVEYETKFFNLKELDILGSRNATRKDFTSVISFLEKNQTIANGLVSNVFDWKDAAKAFTYWESVRDSTFKIVVEVNHG